MTTRDAFRPPQPAFGASGTVVISLLLALASSPGAGQSPPGVNAGSAAAPERGRVGFFAMTHGGDVVASSDADRLFSPASLQKVIVSAALLHHLGPEYRITTELRAAHAPDGSVLTGPLVVRGAGDPSFSRRFHAGSPRTPLTEMAERLVRAGVRRIEGDLVVDPGAFPGWSYPSSRSASEVAVAMGAPVSALSIEGNTVRVRLAPGNRVGVPAVIEAPEGLVVRNRTNTVGAHRDGRGSIEFVPIWGTDEVLVRGEYPISEAPIRLSLTHPNPDLQALRALAEEFRLAGINVTGSLRVEVGAASRTPVVIAFAKSPPLEDLLVPVLQRSDNWLTDMLLRQLGLNASGEGRLDLSLDVLEGWLTDVVGVDAGSFKLEDGSGLSVHNLVTPRMMVEVLAWSYEQPFRGALFAALPSPRTGTLSRWPTLPPLHAKTGTLQNTVALAGVLDGQAQPVFFAHIIERGGPTRQAQRRAVASWLRELSGAEGVQASSN